MKLEVPEPKIEELALAIDDHWQNLRADFSGILTIVHSFFSEAQKRTIAAAEYCSFEEFIDEAMFKWDGRNPDKLVEILTEKVKGI